MTLRTVAGSSIILTAVFFLAVVAVVLALDGSAGAAAAWAVALTVATRLAPMLASFPVAYWPRREGRAFPLGVAITGRVVARELWATLRLFFYYHPLERLVARRDPDHVEPGRTPIVLVHGFYANAGFWCRIREALTDAGHPNLFSLNLEPPFADIDEYAAQLDARIRGACERCGADDVIVVAHSMGGLVARACARRFPGRIRHVVAMGSPHHGTLLASLVPAVNTRQMRPGSDWLRGLNAESDAVPVTSLYSEHDNIIVPQASAELDGARNTRLTGIGHLDMAFSPFIINALNEVLWRIESSSST